MDDLKIKQAYPLDLKIKLTKKRIKEFYSHFSGQVYISFSGGKDSTVLLHLVRSIFPDLVAVFCDTGLEFPEIKDFIKTVDNVIYLKPKMNFRKVLKDYGYPVVSKENAQKINEIRNTKSDKLRNKRLYGDEKGNGKLPEKWKFLINEDFKISSKCCDIMKKRPFKQYEKETGRFRFEGTMATDSRLRLQRPSCNMFDSKRPSSAPLRFWSESDIWEYITKYQIEYSDIYKMGYERTGCVFCMFGVHLEGSPNRFQKLRKTHPKLHKYCMNNLGLKDILSILNIPIDDYLSQLDLF